MNNILKKWLIPLIIVAIIFIFMIVSLVTSSKLPKFDLGKESVDKDKIVDTLKMLETDKKSEAKSELEELYKDKEKDDAYYIALAKIIMANSNAIDGLQALNNVENKTIEYYTLRIKSEAGAFFTMGEVPDGLLKTAIEATENYSEVVDFPLLLGELYYDKDNYVAASYYLDKALQIDNYNTDALYYYSLSIYMLGESDEAINYMNKAISSYKGSDETYKTSMNNYLGLMKEGKR